jgi:hypothetical protein
MTHEDVDVQSLLEKIGLAADLSVEGTISGKEMSGVYVSLEKVNAINQEHFLTPNQGGTK